jgi:A/G-specific adenine glycosylase
MAATIDDFTPQRLGRIRTLLLDWYDEFGDDFPWRSGRDPYAALVAAVCSQQTQISRVIVLYERWMAAFPTLPDAAAATRARVLRVWGRGGYPRRAVALHESARICIKRHDGAVPRDEDALLALPGVGPFTAAIVRCYGFGDDAVAIDTNIVRVIGRVVFGDLQPARETPPAAIEQAARRLLRPGTAARWNPALMEYGGRVCTPRPHCDGCVIARLCAAAPRFRAGERAEPVRAQPKFEGSDRQWRGRLLTALRDPANAGGVPIATLVRRLASQRAEAKRLRALLAALCDDGLAWSHDGRCGLGERRRR